MKKTFILGIALLLVLSSIPLAQAQQNQAMGIPPDSPFYFFQGWSEGFQGMFRGGDPEFHEELALRRQAEVGYLEGKGEEGLIQRLRLRERLQEHQKEAMQIRERERVREGNPETGQGPMETENQGETQGSGSQGETQGSGSEGSGSQGTGGQQGGRP